MTIWIDNDTKRRVHIQYQYKGFSRLDTPEQRAAANVVEIADDPVPADYSDEFYYRSEDWNATQRPYTVYTRKSDEQIAEIVARKQAQAETAAAKAENKANATVKYLTTHTAAQIENYVDTNITNLATAKTVIARLAVAVGALLRD